MLRKRLAICLVLAGSICLAPPLPAQESEDADEPEATEVDERGLSEEDERLAEIVGADEEGESGEYTQEEDDDFVPTQEVSSDQSVNFPVDI